MNPDDARRMSPPPLRASGPPPGLRPALERLSLPAEDISALLQAAEALLADGEGLTADALAARLTAGGVEPSRAHELAVLVVPNSPLMPTSA